MSFALHLHQVFVKESKYTLKHGPATLSLAFITHSFYPHPCLTGPCSRSTPTSTLTQGAMLLRVKIYSLLFSHSLVKCKGIWAVGQFAPFTTVFFQCERPKYQMPYIFLGQNQAQGFFQGWLWQINVSIQDSRCSQEPTKHSLLPLGFLGRPQTHRRINCVAQNTQV